MCVYGEGEMKTVGETFVSGRSYKYITTPPTLEKRRVPLLFKNDVTYLTVVSIPKKVFSNNF